MLRRADEPSPLPSPPPSLGKSNQNRYRLNPNIFKQSEEAPICPNTDEESMIEEPTPLVPVHPEPPAYEEVLARTKANIIAAEDEQADKEYFLLRYPEDRYDELAPHERETLRGLRLIDHDPAEHIERVPTQDEYVWERYWLHTEKMSQSASDKLQKRLEADYKDYYGSVEQQALLYSQRGGKIKRRLYSDLPGAIRSRTYRERLEEDGMGEDVELREKARVRMQVLRAKTPETLRIKQEEKEAKKLARKAANTAYQKAKRALKTNQASKMAPPEEG